MSLQVKDITILKMLTTPPKEIVKAGYKMIRLEDGYVYQFDLNRCKWEQKHYAQATDYIKLPQL